MVMERTTAGNSGRRRNGPREDLLDVLSEKMNCEFLSDLRRLDRPNAQLQRLAAELPLNAFPAKAWINAANYICNLNCARAEEARSALLTF